MSTRLIKILGVEGLLLLLFGLMALLFAPAAQIIGIAFLAAGAVCLAAYAVFGWTILRQGIVTRSARFGANAATYTLIVLAILVLVNFVVQRHPKEWDATSAKVNTLADQSIKVLDNLDQNVHVVHFAKPLEAEPMKKLLERYERESERFTFEIVDPDREPQRVQELEVKQYGESVAMAGEKKHNFTGLTEQDVTNALIQVTRAGQRTVYFVEGHGEPDIDNTEERGYQAFAKALNNESIQTVKLLLASMNGIPEDADAVIVAGPQKPLLDGEIEILKAYADAGGSLLFLLDPVVDTGLETMLRDYGVTVDNTIVVDQQLQLFMGPTLGVEPIVESYGPHPITRDFRERTVYNLARSLTVDEKTPDGVTVTDLARTGPQSWGETDLRGLIKDNTVDLDDEDVKGPVAIAVAIEKEIDKPENEPEEKDIAAKIVVAGDSDFANNKYANYLFNTDLALNMVNWLVGEESTIAIRPRSYAPSAVQLTSRERAIVFYLSVFIIPQLMMMIGVAVVLRRR